MVDAEKLEKQVAAAEEVPETNPVDPPARAGADDKPKTDIKEVTVDGYKFTFDAEKIDDVEVIEMAAQIEEGQTAKIIQFVKFLIGDKGYEDMKAYFVAKDGRFKLTTLMRVFEAIFQNFNPKG